jgi:uncharacterized protein with HEPN domain
VRDDRLYLIHITECIERIERYTAAGQPAFLSDTMTQDAVLRNLQPSLNPRSDYPMR